MKIQAVIFDIYGTLLEVGPPPADRDKMWEQQWLKMKGISPPVSLDEFARRCRETVSLSHARDKKLGIAYPEVDWPAVARAALPELAEWPGLPDFLYEHAQLVKTVRLMPGADKVLRHLAQHQVLMGLCSNCQAYSLRELDRALIGIGLNSNRFHSRICFLSFQWGFSKPNPKAFHILQERLDQLGASSRQILMVGDRQDNDIDPARLLGWQTWRLSHENVPGEQSGDWQALDQHIGDRLNVLPKQIG